MENLVAFSETVRGASHIQEGTVCEDASKVLCAENGKYRIAAVADGHGAESCFRSERGSKTAVDIAVEQLKKYAETFLDSEEAEEEFYQDFLGVKQEEQGNALQTNYQEMSLCQLKENIVSSWREAVDHDYINNPPSGEGMEEENKAQSHASVYGTTLIAALWMEKCLILLQQGDGRATVFFENGKIDQPVPWDPRCSGNVTTSLCDANAAESMRVHVINLETHPVAAVFLESDGVEDSFRDSETDLGGSHTKMAGLYACNKNLIYQLNARDEEGFKTYLKEFLSDLSLSGSQDDISVAGIVDMATVQKIGKNYENEIQLYQLEDRLILQKEALRGKERKHKILLEKMSVALKAYQKALEEREKREKEYIRKKEEREHLLKSVNELEESLKNHWEEQEHLRNEEKTLKCWRKNFQEMLEKNQLHYQQLEEDVKKSRIKADQANVEVQKAHSIVEEKRSIEETLNGQMKTAQDKYNEFDLIYKEISTQIHGLQEEISQIKKALE